MATTKTIGPGEIQAAIARLADAIGARHRDPAKLILLGVANGGVELARRLAAMSEKGKTKGLEKKLDKKKKD